MSIQRGTVRHCGEHFGLNIEINVWRVHSTNLSLSLTKNTNFGVPPMKTRSLSSVLLIFACTLTLLSCTDESDSADSSREAIAMDYNPLTEEEQRIILREGTERAFTGKYNDHDVPGIYTCKQCDRPLFNSDSKFKSGTGWPSFDDFIAGAIREVPDGSRREIECANCGGHVGHVFRSEQFTAKNTRHCANSLSLNFVEDSKDKTEF